MTRESLSVTVPLMRPEDRLNDGTGQTCSGLSLVSQVGGTDHNPQLSGTAMQARVEGHKAAVEKQRQSHVLSVISFGPAEIFREFPSLAPQVAVRSGPYWGGLQPFESTERDPLTDLASPKRFVQTRSSLRPHVGWRYQVLTAEEPESILVGTGRQSRACVQHQQLVPRSGSPDDIRPIRVRFPRNRAAPLLREFERA